MQGLLDSISGQMVGDVNQDIVYTPLEDTWGKKKVLDDELKDIIKLLCE